MSNRVAEIMELLHNPFVSPTRSSHPSLEAKKKRIIVGYQARLLTVYWILTPYDYPLISTWFAGYEPLLTNKDSYVKSRSDFDHNEAFIDYLHCLNHSQSKQLEIMLVNEIIRSSVAIATEKIPGKMQSSH